MVVPYLGAAAVHHQQSQLSPSPPADTGAASVQTSPSSQSHSSSQQIQFIGLLQQAERRHREALQRALDAENQVQQLRRVFQQWQLQLREQLLQRHQQDQSRFQSIHNEAQLQFHQVQNQLQLIQQQHVHQQVQLQRQVQKQMQALHDAVLQRQHQQENQQEQENQRVREQLKDMYNFQQLQSYVCQQQMGELQGQMCSLERSQRTEKRNRQVLQRQTQQTRRWQQLAPQPAAPQSCPDDDCCPCEFPEQCPFNPCNPDTCCVEVPERTDGGDCLLRNLRLGLGEPSPHCTSVCQSPLVKGKKKQNHFVESEDGYLADDERSLCSDVSSGHSSSFKEERRQILQEVRNLENIRLVPRYKQSWQPLRCFRCNALGHLATFCRKMPTTIL